jgi:hypothetical protein
MYVPVTTASDLAPVPGAAPHCPLVVGNRYVADVVSESVSVADVFVPGPMIA